MFKDIIYLIGDYWWLLVGGIALGVLTYYVPIVKVAMIKIWAMVNKEKVVIDVLMFIMGIVVKSTKNQLDDRWYNEAAKKLGYPVLPSENEYLNG